MSYPILSYFMSCDLILASLIFPYTFLCYLNLSYVRFAAGLVAHWGWLLAVPQQCCLPRSWFLVLPQVLSCRCVFPWRLVPCMRCLVAGWACSPRCCLLGLFARCGAVPGRLVPSMEFWSGWVEWLRPVVGKVNLGERLRMFGRYLGCGGRAVISGRSGQQQWIGWFPRGWRQEGRLVSVVGGGGGDGYLVVAGCVWQEVANAR